MTQRHNDEPIASVLVGTNSANPDLDEILQPASPDEDVVPLRDMQWLPIGCRRMLLGRMAKFDPPDDWREDQSFYRWLFEHYEKHGADHVDAALAAIGGNNARRTLVRASAEWASRQGVKFDLRQDPTQQLRAIAASGTPAGNAVLWVIAIAAIESDDAGDANRDAEQPEVETAADDRKAAVADARSVLDRAEAEGVDEAGRVLIGRFTRDLAELLARQECARQQQLDEARVLAAVEAVQSAVAKLPTELLADFATPIASRDQALLDEAALAIENLSAAATADRQAALRLQQAMSLSERRSAQEDSNRAFDTVTAAHSEAVGLMARIAEPTTRATFPLAERNDERDTDKVTADGTETANTLPPATAEIATAEIASPPISLPPCTAFEPELPPLPPTAAAEANNVTVCNIAPDESETEEWEEPVAAPTCPPMLDVPGAETSGDAEPCSALLDQWDCWVRTAVDSGHLGLGVHLARGRELAGADRPASWPSVLMKALAFGMGVEANNDRAAGRYEELVPALVGIATSLDGSAASDLGKALALIGGAVRPALLANYAGIAVIDALPSGRQLTSFHDLMELLRHGPQLGLAALQDLSPQAEASLLELQRQSALDELRKWNQSVKSRTMPYQPATALWQLDLIKPEGVLGAAVTAVLEGRADAETLAQNLADALRNDPDGFLDLHFRRFMKGKGKSLEGIARLRFLNLLQEARDLFDTWLRASRPVARPGGDRFERFRAPLKAALAASLRAVAELVATGEPDVRTGAALLGRVLEQLNDRLHGRFSPSSDGQAMLDTEIALLPDFPLNGRISFEICEDDVVALRDAAETGLAQDVWTWDEAFERALAISAPGVARRLQPFITSNPDEADMRIDAVVQECRRRMQSRRTELRAQLDDFLSATLGDSSTYESALQALESFDLAELPRDGQDEPGAIGDFPFLFSRLESFGRMLDRARQQVGRELGSRIALLEEDGGPLGDCRAMLERGNLGTLAEELSQIERFGADRRSTSSEDLLERVEYFATQVLSQTQDAPELQGARLRDAAARGEAQGKFRFDLLAESEREKAKELLDRWNRLKTASLSDHRKTALVNFLGALGFSNVRISGETSWREGRRYNIKVDPLRSAGDCIVPAFGSQAAGSYTVLVMPKGTLEKSLQSGFNELQPPVIALAMEWLSPKARQVFLRKSRGRPAAAFALLDDPAVSALAATPGRNLRSFFSLAVPFGAARPYSDTGAVTSIEMFFGRDREYDLLVDPQGSCLVYGGRQLGKTALLKQIEQRNESNPDTIVIYCDIKNVGSIDLPISVWDRICEELRKKQIPGTATSRGDNVIEAIRTWLRGQAQRRLLILLDEADNFLESEMESDFPNIMKMKGLMEDTGRRAKFVYAGLHNVQRFVRAPNSPMLHLGEPVNIGPLLGNDRHAARQMVLEPMAAAGVGFVQSTDAHHVLSLVGYYPSLLQTFGKSLLAKVDERLSRRGEPEQLPERLDRLAIEQGFKVSEFRNELREKFRATLELDPRYELIAYVVCLQGEEDRSKGRITGNGYGNREIFELAQEYWPQGFADIRSSDTFGAILDEMVGLGVLARSGEGYALRSARIAAMLGDPEQITTHLLEFADRPRPLKPDPLANHRALPNGAYSPLTWRQEKTLVDQLRAEKHPTSLAFVAGSKAVADTDDLVTSLQSLVEMQDWPQPRILKFRRVEDLQRVIQTARREATAGHPKLVICRDRWPEPEQIAVLDGMKELRDSAHPVRVVFLGSARDQTHGRASASTTRMVKSRMIDLTPWDKEAIQLWLLRHARSCADDPLMASQIHDITGGFSVVFDQVSLPKGNSADPTEILQRLQNTADRHLSVTAIGLDADGVAQLARKLIDFDDEHGLSHADLRGLADETDRGSVALEALQAMGLLVQVQKSGDPHWRLCRLARDILGRNS